jgi:hypothetical protein
MVAFAVPALTGRAQRNFAMKKLEQLDFDNSFARLPDTFYSRLNPSSLPDPYLISFNEHAARLIDLDAAESLRADFAECFIGNRLLPGSEPLAMLYAGHQFGHYVPQLGDGRAILLGEVRNGAGERWDVQLKGAGLTPYSRSGDGRAVLRSSIREYLCSEAMHALGIPTTRALCITGSDEHVYLVLVAQPCSFQRLSELSVEPRDGGKVVNPRIADPPAVFQEKTHVTPPNPAEEPVELSAVNLEQ